MNALIWWSFASLLQTSNWFWANQMLWVFMRTSQQVYGCRNEGKAPTCTAASTVSPTKSSDDAGEGLHSSPGPGAVRSVLWPCLRGAEKKRQDGKMQEHFSVVFVTNCSCHLPWSTLHFQQQKKHLHICLRQTQTSFSCSWTSWTKDQRPKVTLVLTEMSRSSKRWLEG